MPHDTPTTTLTPLLERVNAAVLEETPAAAVVHLSPPPELALKLLRAHLAAERYTLKLAHHYAAGNVYLTLQSDAADIIGLYIPVEQGGLYTFAGSQLIDPADLQLAAYDDVESKAAREYVRRRLEHLVAPPAPKAPQPRARIGGARLKLVRNAAAT